MENYIVFVLIALVCLLIACIYVVISNQKIKSKLDREVKYSRIMVEAASLEKTYYELENNHSLDCYPAIRKYLSQSKYMLDKGIPLYTIPNLTRLSSKDKSLNSLLDELGKAPINIRESAFCQAELMRKIVEAKNPILSKVESLKKNTQIRILLYLLKLLIKMKKYCDSSRINEFEIDNKIMTQSQQIQSAACPDGC